MKKEIKKVLKKPAKATSCSVVLYEGGGCGGGGGSSGDYFCFPLVFCWG